MTDTAVVLTERRDHLLIVTINRPGARNAVNAAVHVGIGTALEQAEQDPEIRAVIVTGAGDKSFCAGADLVALSRGESLAPDDAEQQAWGFGGFAAHPISKPVIGAVNGFAFGGGCELALMCDPIPAARAAQFGLVNHVVPLADLMPAAIALAEKIAANAPLSVQASKRVALGIDEGRIAADAPYWEHNTRERAALMRSEDAREGPLAFAQKRKPQWKAR